MSEMSQTDSSRDPIDAEVGAAAEREVADGLGPTSPVHRAPSTHPERSTETILLSSASALAVFVALVVVATLPEGYATNWSTRAGLYLVAAPIGLVVLVRLAARGDRLARVGLAFVGAAVVSALLAPTPARSLLPVHSGHESVVFFAAGLGAWAVARTLGEGGRTIVQWAFVGSVLASIAAAVLQLLFDVSDGPMALVGGRPEGLSLNPVYLGSLSAGCAAWCAGSLCREATSRWWSAALGVAALGVWISGSRISLLALVCVVVASLVRGWLRVVPVVVLPVVVGVLAGDLLRRVPDQSRDLAGRLGGGAVASGLGVRREVWGFDLEAFVERPLFGYGPGRHTNAIESHYTAEFVARTDPDQFLNGWTDAHNIGIELLVTVGVVGLVLAVAFAVLNMRVARGPAAWAAGAAALSWLLQPVGMVTLIPVAALLGTAVGPLGGDRRGTPPAPMATAWRLVVAAVAVVAGLWFVASDVMLSRAAAQQTAATSDRAATLWFHDAGGAHDAAFYAVRGGFADPVARRRVLDLAAAATDREPDLAYWWIRRGQVESRFDRPDAARRSFERALSLQPWSRAGLASLVDLLDPAEDAERIDELRERLATVDALRLEARGR